MKKEEIQKKLIERVKSLRKSKQWTQREMAREFNVSPGQIAHWESGTRQVKGPAVKLLEIFERNVK